MEKRRLAAQQAVVALQNRAVKEAQAQQAQVGSPWTLLLLLSFPCIR